MKESMMPFELSEEQQDIQKAAKEFAEGEFLLEVALEHDLSQKFPREIWRKGCQLGFIGIHFPEPFGGQGYGVLENILITEQFCRKDSGLGIALSFSDYGSEVVLRYGNDAQKRQFLTPLTKGKAIPSSAFPESDNGDTGDLCVVSKTDKDFYLLNGKKNFFVNGLEADWFVVLCQTGSDIKERHGGRSFLIIERGTKGMEILSSGEKMGIHMTSLAEASFSNVQVPLENRIGLEGEGFYQQMKFLEENQIEIAGQAVGIGQGALEQAVAYAKKRIQFGKPIIENQGLQWMLADMIIATEAARAFLYTVAHRFDQDDEQVEAQVSMLKVFASDVAMKVSTDAVQILGGYGYMEDYPLERMMRDAKATQIYPWTNQLQRTAVANTLRK
jgi:alkylation response protein AidB-like acyl-CoA dehydrogenase